MTNNITYSVLCLFLLAFAPAMIAACKKRSFSKWYLYGVALLPAAFIHSLLLKRPVSCISVYFADPAKPSGRRKKQYRIVSRREQRRHITVSYMCMVFVSKLVFGAFMGLVFFAIFRTFQRDTYVLRSSCVLFSIALSVLLSVTEICGLSHMPMVADEITKRAFLVSGASVTCSLPLFIIKTFVLDKLLPRYSMPWMLVCMCAALVIFVWLLLKMQSYYYSVFYKFFDYCVLSLAAYVIFAAVTLICLSIDNVRGLIYIAAMPLQLFNTGYLAGIDYIENISYIYSSAIVHAFIAMIILVSGLSCRNYKRKELAYRVEYRSRAFNMSQKKMLRRHIPKAGGLHIKPLQHV